MKFQILFTILICLYSVNLFSQSTSIISINNGNMWIYTLTSTDSSQDTVYGTQIKQIIGDTTMTIHIATCDSSYYTISPLKIVEVISNINSTTTTDSEYWYVDSSIVIKNSSFTSGDYRFVFNNHQLQDSTCDGTFDFQFDGIFTNTMVEDSIWNNIVQAQERNVQYHFPSSPLWFNLESKVAEFYGPIYEQYDWYSVLGGSEEKDALLKGAVLEGVVYGDTVTEAENVSNNFPDNYFLSQNYPNPFNPTTTIKYSIPSGNNIVSLKVYDVLGNEIATLVNEEKPVGEYEVNFGASKLANGIYFYQLKTGSFVQTKKMILLR